MMQEYNKLSNFNILLEFPGTRGASGMPYKTYVSSSSRIDNKPDLTGYV